MKNKVLKSLIFLAIIIALLIPNIVFASMADYTDEEAYDNYIEEQNEWNKAQEEAVGKSSNNYLKSISVENYEISPEFERQTVDYSIDSDVASETINITAEAEDENASVSGTGTISLEPGENNLRIDVTAENGTVRTYFIKVNRVTSQDEEKNISNQISNVNEVKNGEENNNNEKDGRILTTVILIIIVLIICLYVALKKHNK